MGRDRFYLLIALLALLVPTRSSADLYAQSLHQWAFDGSYEYGAPLMFDRTPGAINHWQFSGQGVAYDHTLFAGARYSLPSYFSDAFGMAFSGRLGYSWAYYTSTFYPGTVGNVATTNIFHLDADVLIAEIQADAQLSGNKWHLSLGPWIAMHPISSLKQTEEIRAPATARFANSQTTQVIASGDSLSSGLFHAGLSLAFGYDLLGGAIGFRPELTLKIDLSSLKNIPISEAISPGIRFSFPLQQEQFEEHSLAAFPAAAQSIEQAPEPDSASLSVMFTVRGERPSPNTSIIVQVNNTLFKAATPLPGVLENTSSLHLSKKEEDFTYNSLARLPANEVILHEPDILGLRLRRSSVSTVELLYASSAPPTDLLFLEQYLHRRWDIDSNRIHRSLNRESSLPWQIRTDALAAPVTSQWIEQDYYIPDLGMRKSIWVRNGVDSWEIQIRQGEKIVATINNASRESALADASFDLSQFDDNGIPLPLTAQLQVIGKNGKRYSSFDTLQLPKIERNGAAIKPDRTYSVYNFFTDRPDDDQLQAAQRSLITKIISSAHIPKEITICCTDENRTSALYQKIYSSVSSQWKNIPLHLQNDLTSSNTIVVSVQE